MTTLVQTYVYYKDRKFFVSTINRRSSAVEAYGAEYAETFVWEWNGVDKDRGYHVHQGEGSKDSIRVHQKIVEQIFEYGAFWEEEND